MPETTNYLLGYGERLREPLEPPRIRPTKNHPYTFSGAQGRLAPQIERVAVGLQSLPAAACPNDSAVAVVTLHPAYLAKTQFPTGLLSAVGLEAVGSRPRRIRPELGGKKLKEEPDQISLPLSPTSEIFVAGQRRRFRQWASNIVRWTEETPGAAEIIRVEQVRIETPEDRLRPIHSKIDEPLLEVVLHAPYDYVIEGFQEYLRTMNVDVDLDRRIQVQGLCFLPVRIPKALLRAMAQYSFLRVAREMPKLRELRPGGGVTRAHSGGFECQLPTAGPINPELRVAVFDGGIPQDAHLEKWVMRRKPPKIETAVASFQAHGLAVTSALLFGPLEKGRAAARPYAPVDHYRVLDESTKRDPQEDYFEVLERITSVLSQKKYDFVNLSIGPDLPIEDDDVHVWTAQLDQLFSDGKTLVTVAAGNSGEQDRASGNARIQAPSDAVNVLAVGASDHTGDTWTRAPYSSLGPGRSPGIIKPDVLAFGGTDENPFWVLSHKKPGHTSAISGTSFASPFALRTAIGVRAYLGPIVQPLALRALLVHHSEDKDFHPHEVGWGRIPSDVEKLIICPPGTAHVLYQGELEAGKYWRLRIPVPSGPMKGKVTISATFCYATETDPQDPINYTRAGLEIKFRPNKSKRTPDPKGKIPDNPDTMPFFQLKEINTEADLRRDAHQWETCLKRTRSFNPATLNDPVFDVHYNARKGGHLYQSAKPIPYALVVTVSAPKTPDLYNDIVRRYRAQLQALQPVIRIPVRAS